MVCHRITTTTRLIQITPTIVPMNSARIHHLMAYALFALVVGAYVLMALHFPMGYIWATYEDLYGEWAQVYLFTATFLLAFRLSLVPWHYRSFFVLLTIACFYVAMEEISWGQRLLGFSSPEFFQSQNLQGETNLHNLLVGPYRTTLKTVIEYSIASALLVYGLLYPLAYAQNWRMAHWLEHKGVVVPPIYLWPFFCLSAFLELSILSFNEAEVAEMLVGIGLSLMSIHYLHALHSGPLPADEKAWSRQDARRLAGRFFLAITIVVALSALTTHSIYSSDNGRQRINLTIEKGVEKFARRYKSYSQWDKALVLYQRLQQRYPRDPHLFREIAMTAMMAGLEGQAQNSLQRALDIDLLAYRHQPDSPQINQSLAQTYELLGDRAKTQYHLQQALRLGLDWIRHEPANASAAYSLGRTYALLGRNKKAFEHFKMAVEINPESEQFRQAYYELQQWD